MNCYIVVEGKSSEKKVYRAWMNSLLPHLIEARSLEDIDCNKFLLISGNGYPQYLTHIENGLKDVVAHGGIDHFIIAIDAENDSVEAKVAEVQAVVDRGPRFREVHIIVQNCCLETWFLGHSRMLKTHPAGDELRRYKEYYDVSVLDPELMGCMYNSEFRAQFHFDYLRVMLAEQFLSYSKKRPGPVCDRGYFDALFERWSSSRHIPSFGRLVDVFSRLGASL